MTYTAVVAHYHCIVWWLEMTAGQEELILLEATFEDEEERTAYMEERSQSERFYDIVGLVESFWTTGGEGLPMLEQTIENGLIPARQNRYF